MNTNELTPANDSIKMYVSIEQGEHTHTSEFTLVGDTTVGSVANILLNEAFSMLSIERLTKTSKNRPSLNKPFTFALGFEAGTNDPSRILQIKDFNTKISMSDKGVEKLIKNMPQVIAELIISKTIPFAERRAQLKAAESVPVLI